MCVAEKARQRVMGAGDLGSSWVTCWSCLGSVAQLTKATGEMIPQRKMREYASLTLWSLCHINI